MNGPFVCVTILSLREEIVVYMVSFWWDSETQATAASLSGKLVVS